MKEIFKKHPKLEVYYTTSDNNAFFFESDAKNHAKGLEDKAVTPVYRHDKETLADDNSAKGNNYNKTESKKDKNELT